MEITNYSKLRNNLKDYLNKVTKDTMPIIITRANKEPIVMMPLEEFNSYKETIYLLRSPKNRDRLLSAIKNVKNKKYSKKDLIE